MRLADHVLGERLRLRIALHTSAQVGTRLRVRIATVCVAMGLVGCTGAAIPTAPGAKATLLTAHPGAAEQLSALRAQGASVYWKTRGQGCTRWQIRRDRIERDVEEDDGRIVRHAYGLVQMDDVVELSGESVEMLRLPGPPDDLPEGAGFGIHEEGSSGCGATLRIEAATEAFFQLGPHRWYRSRAACDADEDRTIGGASTIPFCGAQ